MLSKVARLTLPRPLQPTTFLITKALCAVTIALSLPVFTVHSHAQTTPLPYGTVQSVTALSGGCPGGGWVSGMTCFSATMHCDASLNVDDIPFTFGYQPQPPSVPYKGTVVALSGGTGTAPATTQGHEVAALNIYLADGYSIVQLAWKSDWEAARSSYLPINPYGNIQNAACRPAGFLHFVYNSTAANNANPVLFTPGGGMCAHGVSAGSAAIVYALSWYGAGWGATGYLDNVELLSGPVLAAVDIGCSVPQIVPSVTVCQGSPGCRMASGVQPWSLSPEYVDGDEKGVREWTNIYACANSSAGNTAPWNGIWNGMSILSSSVTAQQLSYPGTSANAWLCANVDQNPQPPNNSAPKDGCFIRIRVSTSPAGGSSTP
jgi:hypothetical protein